MIIFGSKGRIRKGQTGTFHCPGCGAARQYTQIKTQTWFTLYFVPIFPMITHGEHVECNTCASAFEMQALHVDPAQVAADRDAIIGNLWRSVMISVASAFGQPNGAQASLISKSLTDLWGITSAPHEILGDCGNVPAAGVAADAIVGKLTSLQDFLTAQAKEDFLASARDVLRAGYGSMDRQTDLLRGLGKALGMSDAHVRGVIMI